MMWFLIIWFLLGIHSVYYFIKLYRKQYDITLDESFELIICFLLPVITHFTTWCLYSDSNETVLFKKK